MLSCQVPRPGSVYEGRLSHDVSSFCKAKVPRVGDHTRQPAVILISHSDIDDLSSALKIRLEIAQLPHTFI